MGQLDDLDTAWTRMRRAKEETAEGRAALAEIMGEYWKPLYHYVRQKGHVAEDAQDLTQGFVAYVLESRLVQNADPAMGSFRSLLKVSLNNYISKARRREQAQIRGGGAERVALDFDAAEAKYRLEIDKSLAPDEVLQQQWADSVQRRVSAEVAKYYARKNRLDRFEALLPFVFEPPAYGDYARIGEQLGMSRNHVAVFVERLEERWKRTAAMEEAWMFAE